MTGTRLTNNRCHATTSTAPAQHGSFGSDRIVRSVCECYGQGIRQQWPTHARHGFQPLCLFANRRH